MSEFSVVCCVSRPDIFQSCLLESVNQARGGHDIEIIPIINDNNRYSASAALNIGIDVARSDILIFAHQDVRLLYRWFDTLKLLLGEIPDDWGVLGSAGIALKYGAADIGKWGGAKTVDSVAVGSVWDSDEKLTEPPYWDGSKDLTQVHCVDECLLVLNKKTGLRFDTLFTGFHFYGIDLCLQARAAAYGVYCAHLPIIHYGKYSASFQSDKKYWAYLRFLHNKWRFRFPEVLGTHMHWTSVGPSRDTPELTSYISVSLDAGGGNEIRIRAMGINKVRLTTDQQYGMVGDS